MTRLKKGDICPICGEPLKTSDPFTLGYLSALYDVMRGEREPDIIVGEPHTAGRTEGEE